MKTKNLLLFVLAALALAATATAGDLSLGHVLATFGVVSPDALGMFGNIDSSALAAVGAAGAIDRDSGASVTAQLQRIANEAEQVTGTFGRRLQNLEQHVAGADMRGLPGAGGHRSVSAQVLAEAESGMEDLRSGRHKNIRMSIPTFHPQAASITSTNVPGRADRDEEVYGPLRRQLSVRDLLVTRPTTAGSIEYLRGTRTGNAAIQASEGDAKAELAMNFALMTASVKTIACWVPASRQVLDDTSMLGDYIDGELRDALRLTEDAQLLKGDGNGANVLGLWSVATAFNRGTGAGGVVDANDKPADTLRRAVTQLQLARGVPTGIVINPVGLEKLELAKDNEGRYMMDFDVRDNTGRTVVWRVPAVVTDAIGPDQWMVADFTRAARLYDRMQATVEVATQHADFFTRNLVAILAEERVALTVNRPDLLVVGTFGAPV